MAWPKAMPIVEVEWVDSNSDGGWSSPELYMKAVCNEDALLCRSTGYLFHRGARTLTIVQSQSKKNGNLCDSITIPRFAVRSYRVLEKPQRGKGK